MGFAEQAESWRAKAHLTGVRLPVLVGVTALAAIVLIAAGGALIALFALGVGWNFGFVGASALVLECHRPEEKSRVQSFNDFIVFGMVAFGSLLSGSVLTAYGWSTVLWLSFVPLALASIILARGRKDRAAVPT